MEDTDKTVIGMAPIEIQPSIIVLRDSDGTEIELQGEMIVGRSDDCDITVDDSRVSRKHAAISMSDSIVSLEDLKSANGTYVNGQRLQGRTVLADGDTIAFDNNVFTLLMNTAGSAASENVAEADPDATMIGMAPVDLPASPEPTEPPPVQEPAPAAPVEEVKADLKLPGSWDEAEGVDGTQLLQVSDLPNMSDALQTAAAGVDSDMPHLVITTATGSQVVELSVDGDTSVWEIGREPGCEIVIDDASVSSKHAQLVFNKGRWRMVNMVSTNGIFVNGEKKLSAYLAEGDEVQLGAVNLMFRAGSSVAVGATAGTASSSADSQENAGAGMTKPLIAVVVLLVLAGGAFVLFGM
ncbi:MAG: FHA domain-containing protein [Pseudomonadales bacterium]